MDPALIASLLDLGKQFGAGATGLLLLALVGVLRGWWYTGLAYRALDASKAAELAAKDREIAEWRRIALHSTDLIGDAVEVAKTK